ncbi:hypothetical protein ACX9NE_15675 [Mycobacterium sp. ML4]
MLNIGTALSRLASLGVYNAGLRDIGYLPRALYVGNLSPEVANFMFGQLIGLVAGV